jgi:transcriptional regulator with XRE-family HTH domain
MDNRQEAREFLVSRRAKLTPEQANLSTGTNRRVPGLRRSEVATLAGVSIEYYSKLERGALAGVSAGVLDAIARVLQLDDAERAHLFDLAHAAGSSALVRPRRRAAKPWSPRPSLQWTLDAVTDGPAFVRNGRMDLLAANRLARAFYADVYADPQRPANLARFTFLDQRARRFYPDWDLLADITVAILRTEAGRDPHDKELQNLVGELSTRSDEFRKRWGAHNVRHHGSGAKTYHHPIVGELTLAYEGLELAAEPGLTLTIYTAEPGSPSEEALRLLASWAASQEADADAQTLSTERRRA